MDAYITEPLQNLDMSVGGRSRACIFVPWAGRIAEGIAEPLEEL